jgi:membrane protease YdiL (CAAX protease family)
LVNLKIGGILVGAFGMGAANWLSFITDLLIFVIFWLINKYIIKARISYHGSGWLLVLPAFLFLVGNFLVGQRISVSSTLMIVLTISNMMVGLAEEFIFRGIIIGQLKDAYHFSIRSAAVVSAIVFGLIHGFNGLTSGNWNITLIQMFMAIGMGFFLSAVYLITNNLWIPVVCHGISDTFIQSMSGNNTLISGNGIYAYALISFLVFGTLGYIVLNYFKIGE